MNIVETYDLSKSYGKHAALDQINLTVPSGAILGVIGPTGTGKTTLLRLLSTLTTPSGGDASVAGYSITGSPARVRRIVGYMPAWFGVYPNMTVDEYLRFYAECHHVPRKEHDSLIRDLLQLVDLTHKGDLDIGKLSYGMKQRLSLARTLLHDPQVLLLDEPITGIDPRAHVEMRELIKELRNMGKVIVITAPIVSDMLGLCTHLAIIESGKCILQGEYLEVSNLLHLHRTILIKFFGNSELTISILNQTAGITNVRFFAESTPVGNQVVSGSSLQPVIATVLKQVAADYTGGYREASEMLRQLMRSGVQVVSFTEMADSQKTLIAQPLAGNSSTG